MAGVGYRVEPGGERVLRQGDLICLDIVGLAAGDGDGVGRTDAGLVVFVPGAVPGDRLEVRIVHLRREHALGKIVRVIAPASDRLHPACAVADRCGSCQWQTVAYQRQLEEKRTQVIDALVRIGGFPDPPVLPVLAQPRPLGYRNKSTFPVGRDQRSGLLVGYYRRDSHHIVDLAACPVQDPRLDGLLAAAREVIRRAGWVPYDEARHTGILRHLAIRVGERTGELLLTFVVREDLLPGVEAAAARLQKQFPALVGVALNVNPKRGNTIFGETTRTVAGRPYLEEVFDGFTFRIEPTTFFQICTSQAEAMARLVVDWAAPEPSDTVIDAYCGIGTLSLPLARRAGVVVGIESHLRSVEQARGNALRNGLANCRFEVGAVEERLEEFQGAGVVVLDPPRRGAEPSVLEAIVRAAPRRVIYVSCNPATLARDLKMLAAGGYHLRAVQPVDLFAQTCHVESVARLERR